MRALAGDNEHPEKALKPFDLNVDGPRRRGRLFDDPRRVRTGEGARREDSPPVGYGSSNDAYEMIGLDEAGAG